MSFTHVAMIPLIGGEAIASTIVFGSRPEYILSYSDFEKNEEHLLKYWNNEVPYYLLDKGQKHPYGVDVVSSVCPCAGLSTLSKDHGSDNEMNKWLIESSKYILEQMKPKVYWGENSKELASIIGKPLLEQLRKIGKENGYTMTVYRTKSLLHGVPQVRDRSFFFFWKSDSVPVLNWYKKDVIPIEKIILDAKKPNDPMDIVINKNVPTQDPYYKYLLEMVHSGISHKEYFEQIDSSKISVRYLDVKSAIEAAGHTYDQLAIWMEKQGLDKEVEKCKRMALKLQNDEEIMRRGTIIPKGYIGAFVARYPMMLTHPYEDRYITYREALAIMGMPQDFNLVKAKGNHNHICQNVPVQTATDMATEVLEYLNGNREMIKVDYILQNNISKTNEFETNTLESFFE